VNRLLAQPAACQARLERIVEFAHRQLSLDVAYVGEFRDGMQLYRAVSGDAASFNMTHADGLPAVATYDQRMAAGSIPNVICDASADERVAGLVVTRYARIGAYVGVPILLSDGTLYGTLSCVSHEPDYTLDDRAVSLLSLLAELIVDDLEDQRRRGDLRERIAKVIENGEFDIAYQPVFELAGDRCVALEALARFRAPFGPPARTIAAAEAAGLGVELERAVMRRAYRILPRLAPGQFLALNASPAALLDIARGAGCGEDVPWSRIVVEVTEHSAIEAYAVLEEELAPLRRRGLRIAVDDAGAGYASLRHVLELRPDFIKLDRWLIDGVADDGGRRAAVSAFVDLARELGSTVIAEGVERQEDLEALRELGLDAAQGYLLGGPTSDRDAVLRWCSDESPSAPALRTTQAVGQLSAGIAHEINTPLRFIGDSVTFLEDAVDELLRLAWRYRETLYGEEAIPLEERRRIMREAEEHADVEYLCERIPVAFARTTDGIARVRSIVQAMKRFSHASITESAPADINEAIETTLAVCRNEYKYVASVSLELAELPPVTCNVGELNQVFLNLIINAAQALEEQVSDSGELGVISISTRVIGSDVLIEIADDGPGIPHELQERIYEPFFTTKRVGQGTGQGLALARSTIEGHGGSLDCVSVHGQGARFTIRLPLDRPHSDIVQAA
jgi:EAL domain-containing protein (putative c-di-GMP-specific phosphodiesterase class I)